jgi:hypothetical protein
LEDRIGAYLSHFGKRIRLPRKLKVIERNIERFIEDNIGFRQGPRV